MAKYKVEQFSSNQLDNGNGYLNIFVLCKLINSGNNRKIHEYRIAPDERYPDIYLLNQIISNGFNYSKNSGQYIEIKEDKERLYLWMHLPSIGGQQLHQFSGERMR